ncbi:nucleotidyltransferase family protein [Candidatus Uhrbacteria bacterium]|nr:nucleotidyltransferase family protein [Candidatus Uhrbacteria bacterium]
MSNEEITKKIIPFMIQAGATRAGLFGSSARQQLSPESDVDILVDLPMTKTLLDFITLKMHLEEILGRPVDLVEYGALKPRMREQILKEEIRVYDQGSKGLS